jgi:hypothetical protein
MDLGPNPSYTIDPRDFPSANYYADEDFYRKYKDARYSRKVEISPVRSAEVIVYRLSNGLLKIRTAFPREVILETEFLSPEDCKLLHFNQLGGILW